MSAPVIRLQAIDKRFPNGLLALQKVSMEVGDSEFVSLLGPSGCGKSSVLRMVAGLDQPTLGSITAPALQAGADSHTAFVFQDAALMPWADVFDNVWLPLRLRGETRADSLGRVRAALRAVGLANFEGAFPSELSGGMRMRASIARALVTLPRVLLMDEPFAALDEITRQRLNTDLLATWQAARLAVMFVTHSVFEAVFLSQRVLVMSGRPGRVLLETVIDEPYPRNGEFRTSARYAAWCRELSDAMVEASSQDESAR